MLTIDTFQSSDLATLIRFVEAIQEHERIDVPDLKSGSEIGSDYAKLLIRTAAERNGCIRMARAKTKTVGFGCAWVDSGQKGPLTNSKGTSGDGKGLVPSTAMRAN
jgi:hypothetical protein